jgi:hypothetical protein
MSLPCSGNIHIADEGDCHEKDSSNSGLSLHAHHRHGTDNGLWVWSSPTGLLTRSRWVLRRVKVFADPTGRSAMEKMLILLALGFALFVVSTRSKATRSTDHHSFQK